MYVRKKTDEEIVQMLRSAYGYSDEQLLAEFEAAERQLKEHPEQMAGLKAPEGEFEKIMRAVEKKRGW